MSRILQQCESIIIILRNMNIGLRLKSLIRYRTMTQATTKLSVKTSVNISFKVIGEGTTDPEEPPIFLLHGLLGCKREWKGIGKTILHMTKRTVVILDLRNHGNSPHVSSHKYEELAADIIHLLDKLEVDKASFVGHNIGGRTAMCTSLIEPNRVAGLLVVDISPVSTSDHQRNAVQLLTAMKAVDFKKSRKISDATKVAKKQLKAFINDDTTKSLVMTNIRVLKEGGIGWACNLDALIKQFKYIETFPRSMEGKKYDGPCLFIGGQLSEYIPADDLTSIRELFPKAVITYIPKAGHYLHVHDTRSFLEIAFKFLKTHT